MEKKQRRKKRKERAEQSNENDNSFSNRNVFEEESIFPTNDISLLLTNQQTSLNFSAPTFKQIAPDNTMINSTASQTLGLHMLNFGAGTTKFGGIKRKNYPDNNPNVLQTTLNGHSITNKREAILPPQKVVIKQTQQ